jgi:hypothetical protein
MVELAAALRIDHVALISDGIQESPDGPLKVCLSDRSVPRKAQRQSNEPSPPHLSSWGPYVHCNYHDLLELFLVEAGSSLFAFNDFEIAHC